MPRFWRVFYDLEENCTKTISDKEGVIRYKYQRTRQYTQTQVVANLTQQEIPVTTSKMSQEELRLIYMSKAQFTDSEEEHKLFLEFLKSWDGAWIWKDILLP